MAATNDRTIDEKENYWDLTEKQKAIVDAIAENPDANDTEIAELASDDLDEEGVSRAYVPLVRDKQEPIIEQQINRKQEDSHNRTEDLLGKLTEDKSQATGFQGIHERPYDDSKKNGIELNLTRDEVESLIHGAVPEHMQKELLAQVLEKAFE